MGKRHRRKFTDEFKTETVKLIRESGRTVASVAREPASPGSMGLQEFLAEAARVADARHVRPRAPEWAVPLDRTGKPDRPRR